MRLTASPVWREDVPNDPDGGFILGKVLDLDTVSSIEAKCSKTGVGDSNEVTVELYGHKRVNMTAKNCLTGWGNLFDEQGKELKFNTKGLREAIKFVVTVKEDDKPSRRIRFLEWVDEVHSRKYEEYQEGLTEATKNS